MENIKNIFKVNNSYKTLYITILASLIIGILSYNVYVIYAYTNPDGIIEGLTAYSNAGWHIEGCGRWLIPIILSFSANVHMPLITVLGFCLLSGLSAFIIGKLWNETKTFNYVLFALLMCVSHATIIAISYNTVALPYAIACLLSTLFVYLVFNAENIIGYLLSVVCLTCTIGIYQAYIGLSACLVLLTAIILLINKKEGIFLVLVKAIACALISCILYWLSLKVIFAILHMSSASRLASVSLITAISNLMPSILKTYSAFINDFNDSILHKNFIYLLLGVTLVISLVKNLIKKDVKTILFSIICLILVPLASYVFTLATPDQEITINVSYQNILLIPFTIYLASNTKNKYLDILNKTIVCILIWLNIVSANATFTCYKLSYNSINNQMSNVINDVIHNENYVVNETPVIIVGYVSDEALRNNIKTYKYAYGFEKEGNVAFWNDQPISVTYNRQKYVLNYFGIDIKDIEYSTYQEVVSTSEFKNMPTWPNKDSIKIINGNLVVKLSQDNVK